MAKVFFIIFTIFFIHSVESYTQLKVRKSAFDTDLYENVLDEELCAAQLSYIRNSTLLKAEFLDAGIRIPRGILKGNFIDMGNYYQCIDISSSFAPSNIEGKYCVINVPMTQDIELPTFPEWPEEWPEWPEEWPEFPWPEILPNTRQHKDMMRNLEMVQAETKKYSSFVVPDVDLISSRTSIDSGMAELSLRLAVCVPKSCTTKQFIDAVLVNTTAVGFRFSEEYCRLKNDKPLVPGDYVAMGIFGFIILITIVSTSYDLYYTLILNKDPKNASTIGKSFSVYTNTRRLVTFNSVPGTLECLDGIRTLAMVWVIMGHTFAANNITIFLNPLDMFEWMSSYTSLWILAAPITVDTFFLLSGILIVYTTVGKISRFGLLRNIHLFYLQRLLRMFPVLAACILLQASLFNHLSDGPEWHNVSIKVDRCRTYWWATLTYLQNFITAEWCIGPTWYLAVDVQMHILSPIVLFWVLGKRRSAWIALSLGTLTVLVASTTYNYINKFQAASYSPGGTVEEAVRYSKHYYINTLTRCSPFLVGMLFGYLLIIFKGKEVYMPKWFVALGWSCAFAVSAAIIYIPYPIIQIDWYSPFWNGIINSFSRPAWAVCLGWMIFACTHGYGGPINWFLSLRMWKLSARISYAVYIFHYAFINVANSTAVSPTQFTVMRFLYRFLSDLSVAFIVGFIVTVMIDAPFSTLIKLAMSGGAKKQRPRKVESTEENQIGGDPTNPAEREYDRQNSKTKV